MRACAVCAVWVCVDGLTRTEPPTLPRLRSSDVAITITSPPVQANSQRPMKRMDEAAAGRHSTRAAISALGRSLGDTIVAEEGHATVPAIASLHSHSDPINEPVFILQKKDK